MVMGPLKLAPIHLISEEEEVWVHTRKETRPHEDIVKEVATARKK